MEGALTVVSHMPATAGGRRAAIEPASFRSADSRRLTFSPAIQVREALWLSGYTAARVNPMTQRMTVDGDVLSQARCIYEKIQTIVQSAGMDLRHVVRTVDYVTPEGYQHYARVADVRNELFGTRLPALTTVVVDGLLRSGALIEIEALATPTSCAEVEIEVDDLRRTGVPGIRRAGDVLYLSTLASSDPDSSEESGGARVVRQTRWLYERAREVLASTGRDLDHVVKVVEFLTPDAYEQYAQIRRVRESLLARKVAVTTVIMGRGMHPSTLVQMEVVAAVDTKLIAKVEPSDPDTDRAAVLRVGDVLTASGQRATGSDGGQVVCPGDIVGQTRIAYSNLAKVLAAAGTGLHSVVQTTEFVSPAGLAEYRRTAEVRREVFEPPYPAATGVVCRDLSQPNALIEVDAVAILMN